MTSKGSVKEFILITNDEYCFLKNQAQNGIEGLDYREKQKILAQVPASLEYPSSEMKLKRSQTEQLMGGKHWLLKSIWDHGFRIKKKSNRQTSAPQESIDRLHSNTPEKVVGSLLQSGLAGGKIERSRQSVKAIQKTDRVRIDETNLYIFVDH